MLTKAVFIDRDGVINSDTGHYYIYKPADFKLNEGIIDNICGFNKAGFRVIVISNQGGIGKGLYTKADTDVLHELLIQSLAEKGGHIDAIYYCPHHPETGKCLCRKPLPLLLEKASARFNIDIAASYFIGDSPRDMEAAGAAGLKGILAPKNTNISHICMEIINQQPI